MRPARVLFSPPADRRADPLWARPTLGQAQRGIARNGALPMENRCHAIGRHLESPREFSCTHVQGVKFFGQVLP